MVKTSRRTLTPSTPSPVLVSSLVSMRTLTLSPTWGESPDNMMKAVQGQPQGGQPQERLQQIIIFRGRATNQ